MGASAVVAASTLPRMAQADPVGGLPTPPICYESGQLDLPIEEPSKLLGGQDPADLLLMASQLGLGGLQAELDAGDAAGLELATAEALLADLADAHASLTLEVAADGWLGYTQASALGDPGPLGREGDVASGIAEVALRAREHRAKQRLSEAKCKARLSQHDDEVLATFDKREKAQEEAEKAMTSIKKGSEEVAKLAHKDMWLKMRDVRLQDEKSHKKQASALFSDGTIDKVKAATYYKRIEEQGVKLQNFGDTLDARLLEGVYNWATTELAQERRLKERKRKTTVRGRLEEDSNRGGSEHLSKRAFEERMKREKSALIKADPKASEKLKKSMANEEMKKKA